MRARFHSAVIAAALLTGLAVPAIAQQAPPKAAPPKAEWLKPPARLPHVGGDPTKNLDFLFGALKAAPDATIAKAVEERIWAVWAVSRSDTTNLLMQRAGSAIQQKDSDLAIKLLTAVIKIKPDYVEAWNRRATLYYEQKDFGSALADIREVLKREPRHFGALSGLGLILQDIGDDKQALEVYRRVLALYPRMEHIPDVVKRLEEKVEGRDI
ncbi:MAG TPA: tetratricopeptide repeat protein [Pseudolabrys sp.]|jgi:tetratricopeptide (TPR) repeat protein